MPELEQPPTDDDLDGDGEPDDAPKPEGTLGRLVDPSEGSLFDDESEEIATETDEATALTAEESAMHIVDDGDVE